MPLIASNLAAVRQRIAAAAKGTGRDVVLVAVTKAASVVHVRELLSLGVRRIGENRVLAAKERFEELGRALDGVEKHFIGHLQTNKVREAMRLFDVIESVDSLRLAKAIDQEAASAGKTVRVFIEVNVSGEEQKFGVVPEDTGDFYNKIVKLPHLKVEGVMCMAPLIPAEQCRPHFRRARQLFEALPLTWLSMGMSNDYVVAIEEGANMVRVGSALFEE